MAQAVRHRPFTTEARLRSQVGPRGICGGQGGTGTGFSPEYFGSPLFLSFHQYPILIFMYTLLLSEGQAGEAREPSMLFRKSGSIRFKKYIFSHNL
jgi:hypothetical protein